jgi:hypothetical protein
MCGNVLAYSLPLSSLVSPCALSVPSSLQHASGPVLSIQLAAADAEPPTS